MKAGPYGHHYFVLGGLPGCNACHGPTVLHVNVSATGFSCGEEFKHEIDCPELRCPHGVLWAEDCEKCDSERVPEDEEV